MRSVCETDEYEISYVRLIIPLGNAVPPSMLGAIQEPTLLPRLLAPILLLFSRLPV
jgi:hypothetical protein